MGETKNRGIRYKDRTFRRLIGQLKMHRAALCLFLCLIICGIRVRGQSVATLQG